MWCYVTKKNLENYLNKYPNLSEIYQDICLYESENKIFLPRYFYKNYPDGIEVFKSQQVISPEPTFYKFTGKLRPSQVNVVNTVLELYRKNGYVNGIIKCPPGLGKTVLSIYIAAQMGVKTCVIVDNDSLLRQWIAEFKKFTDLKESEIGIIKQKMFSTDVPVSIALVQSLVSKIKNNLPKNFNIVDKGRFGLVIYDEVHGTSSAPKFAKASLLFRTLNMIGLSATPFQTGAAEILMKNTVGDIIYESKEYDLKPKYVMNYYDSDLATKYSGSLARRQDYIHRKAYYNSIIVKSNIYFNVITTLVKKRLEEGHRILIVCSTKQQVKMISDKLDKMKISNRKYYGDEKDEVDKENVKVLIVTYAYAGKGFDFKQLSSLILAVNLAGKKSLIQVVGRILRSCDDKLKPVVDDLIDLSFASMFIPDAKVKTSIITEEFNCEITTARFSSDGLSVN